MVVPTAEAEGISMPRGASFAQKPPKWTQGSCCMVGTASERVSCATISLRTRPASHHPGSELLRRRFWWENDCVVDSISCCGTVAVRRVISVLFLNEELAAWNSVENHVLHILCSFPTSGSVGPYHFPLRVSDFVCFASLLHSFTPQR